MQTNNDSVYRLSIGARIGYVLLSVMGGFLFYGLVFEGERFNSLILELLGIQIPLVTFCLNLFFIALSALLAIGGILINFMKMELVISNDSIRYVSGKSSQALKWDELEEVKLITKKAGAVKFRTLIFYEKSDPAKESLSVDISPLEKRNQIITKVEEISRAHSVRFMRIDSA